MAPKDRAPPEHLTFLADAAEGVHSSGLFPLLRGAEARAAHLPRVGTSKRPDQNVVDLKHVPSLFFPPRNFGIGKDRRNACENERLLARSNRPDGPAPNPSYGIRHLRA